MKTNLRFNIGILAALFLAASCSNNADLSDAYGNFEVEKTIVSAQGNGELLSLNIQEGQLLKSMQPIGQIDTLALHLQKEQLKAQKRATLSGLNDIEAQLAVFEQQKANLLINKNRIDRLFEAKAATQKQVDDIRGQLNLIDKQMNATQTQKIRLYDQVNVIQKQIDLLNLSMEKCKIVSPISGTVLNTLARTGEMSAIGKPLFSMADLSALDLRVYVSGAQLPYVKLGDEVEVYIDKNKTENQKLSGKVVWIAQTAEFTPKTIQTKQERVNLVYAVKVRVKNDGTLKIGMPGEVVFPALAANTNAE